jgi:di/tricarboxylate transporter
MGWEAWFTIFVTLMVLVALAREWAADLVFMCAIVTLAAVGVIKTEDAFSGFTNNSLLMVLVLFIVAAGLLRTGVVDAVGHSFLGKVTTEFGALVAICLFTVIASAFMNNTPVVAMLIPVIMSWCRKNNVAPSKLLIPLSFVTILGGTCTLIGTSTNLVVDGLLRKAGKPGLGFFELSIVGVPCAIIGITYMLTIGRKILPERVDLIEQLGATRKEYLVEMMVHSGCRLIGKNVEEGGLRSLPGLYLIEIDRSGQIMGPVSPAEVIEENDRLVFTGIVSTIIDLKNIPGLEPATDQTYKVEGNPSGRRLSEAVISRSSPLIGQTVKEANFRTHYNAAIVAIHRNGHRIASKIGEIEMEAGDTLLLQTGPHFAKAHRNNADFYLVSDVEDSTPILHEKLWYAVAIFGVLILCMVTNIIEPLLAAFFAAFLMIASRCLSTSEARQSIDWPVIIAVGGSFGLGTALEKSGAALFISQQLVDLTSPFGPYATLAAIFLMTMVLNELITNNGAAAIAFPFSVKAAELSGCDERPFVIAVVLAASYAFASPIGYQTHMMVYGPGGYKFSDFVKVGVPLNLLLCIICVILVPLIWPFAIIPPIVPAP